MNSENRITTSEAETFAGVSKTTLLRFADAGYVSVEEDASGKMYFSKEEICKLFNLQMQNFAADKVLENEADATSTPTASETEISDSIDPVGRSTADYTSVENVSVIDQNILEAAIEDTALEIEKQLEIEIAEEESNVAPEAVFNFTPEVREDSQELHTSIATLEQDKHKLERVIELQEQLLDSREAEIKDLKEQRVWLRERLEKSEEKADRDQLLLISEMQMLSKLVNQQQKKSVIGTALTWLGFKEPESEHKGNTIDYKMHKAKRAKSDVDKAA